jgi:DNA-binding transcriptional MerR regulator
MLSAISSSTTSVADSSSDSSQIAVLKKLLALDQKQLEAAQKSATTQIAEVAVQQLTEQITGLEAEIAQLESAQTSNATSTTSATQSASASLSANLPPNLGKNINVTA